MSTIKGKKLGLTILRNYELYLFLLPALAYYVIFQYGPMYGVQIAFKNFMPVLGINGSPWIGFTNFIRFFNSYQFLQLLSNTLILSVYGLVASFPIPIILALMLNQVRSQAFKKFVQTVTYAPHFMSTVVVVGMLFVFLSPSTGVVNNIIKSLGGQPIFFMGSNDLFRPLYVFSGVWQTAGWSSIIYIAALAGVSPELHEAAIMDGASRLRRIWHIDLPGITPTIVTLLILNAGNIMSIGFDKAFLMQTPLNTGTSEIISTYVYKRGLLDQQYSFSSAIGLFNSVINLILIVAVNTVSKTITEVGLW